MCHLKDKTIPNATCSAKDENIFTFVQISTENKSSSVFFSDTQERLLNFMTNNNHSAFYAV